MQSHHHYSGRKEWLHLQAGWQGAEKGQKGPAWVCSSKRLEAVAMLRSDEAKKGGAAVQIEKKQARQGRYARGCLVFGACARREMRWVLG